MCLSSSSYLEMTKLVCASSPRHLMAARSYARAACSSLSNPPKYTCTHKRINLYLKGVLILCVSRFGTNSRRYARESKFLPQQCVAVWEHACLPESQMCASYRPVLQWWVTPRYVEVDRMPPLFPFLRTPLPAPRLQHHLDELLDSRVGTTL